MPVYISRPDHPKADEFGMISKELAYDSQETSSPYVISDEIPATRHMADGQYYTSKAKFRRATRAHNCVEVGNETATVLKSRRPEPMSREKRVHDIKATIEQLRRR